MRSVCIDDGGNKVGTIDYIIPGNIVGNRKAIHTFSVTIVYGTTSSSSLTKERERERGRDGEREAAFDVE
jgi:hypothetical protein